MQRELAQRGIASVTALRESVFSTHEAGEILRLLEALLAIGHESRLRAALASVLIGVDAPAIDALSRDEQMHRSWLDAFQRWREHWSRFGALEVVRELVARAAPRLLKVADGERRLGNYLQVAEEIQNARAHVLGAAGEADWLARRIDDADDYDEAQQQRLESDAKRVRIMTLHKAKGLEFDLVFLPFAGLATAEPWTGSVGLVADRVDGRRALRAKIPGIDDEAYAAAAVRERQELLSEQLRLLYVGLTRARHAAWLYAAYVNTGRGEKPVLAWLLQGGKDGKLRLLQLHRLPGVNAKTGGELQTVPAPGGSGLFSAPAIWKGRWAFVATDGGTAAWLLRGGRLHSVWSNGTGGTSPVLAGNLLYVAGSGSVKVYVPTSGKLVATLPSGPVHWQSPIVAGGRVFMPEGNANDHATTGALDIYRLP